MSAMKNTLCFVIGLLLSVFNMPVATCQTVMLSDDFSGFTTGSHTTPSTSDASAILDSRMKTPGWHGSLIYSAGGEIKIGTASLTGWIEKPPLDLTDSTLFFTISFDIARWTNDASTVRLSLNSTPLGDVLSPADTFTRIEIQAGWSATTVHLKLQGLTKRFYLDNFSVVSGVVTSSAILQENKKAKVWPVPAQDVIHISGGKAYKTLRISDVSGMERISERAVLSEEQAIEISDFTPGVYFILLKGEMRLTVVKFIKR